VIVDAEVSRVRELLGVGFVDVSDSLIWSDLRYYSIEQTVNRIRKKYAPPAMPPTRWPEGAEL
jgi:hypothetical protein